MERTALPPGWIEALAAFPGEIRAELAGVPVAGARVASASVRRLLAATGWSIETLMRRLLPLARCYSVNPISRFAVGAIAASREATPTLFFGANLEIGGGSLNFSVHAEQSAVNHAWLAGAGGISRLAVTDAPCGHCRQFLNELDGADRLKIVLPATRRALGLGELLPRSFGPSDLGGNDRLMRGREIPHGSPPRRNLRALATAAAAASYAPYSGARAGCAIRLESGPLPIAGRSAENAAFNPSLPAFASALSALVLQHGPGSLSGISRVVLAENRNRSSQRTLTEAMLAACAPRAKLEYAALRAD